MEHPERELTALAQLLGLTEKVRPCMPGAFSPGSRYWNEQSHGNVAPVDQSSSKQELQCMSTL